MPDVKQHLLAMLIVSLSAGVLADVGSVAGTVRFEQIPAAPVPPRYRIRTKTPILDPDPQAAIVYLEHDGGYPVSSGTDTVTIAQQGYQFRPAVAVIRRGTTARFPNQDDEFHSVFSYSSAKRFDLGRYRKDEASPLVTFDEPGLVKVYCEIHKHMRHLLLVLDTPWFTVTARDGSFLLEGVPAGEYRIRAFLPSEETLEGTVVVTAGATARIDLRGS